MPASDPWQPRPVRIARMQRETHDVFTLQLDALGFAFEPGQFNMLYLFGVGEVAISICCDPEDGPLEHTIRAVGKRDACDGEPDEGRHARRARAVRERLARSRCRGR